MDTRSVLVGALGEQRTLREWATLLHVDVPPAAENATTDENAFYRALSRAQSAYAPTAEALRACLEVQSLLYEATERRAAVLAGDDTSLYGGQDGLLVAGSIGVGKSRLFALLTKHLPGAVTHPASSPIHGPWVQVPAVAITCPDLTSKVDLYDAAVRQIAPQIGLDIKNNALFRRHRANDLYQLFRSIAVSHAVSVLIIDEIQNIAAQRSGGAEAIKNNLVRLTQETGVALVAIGTPPALEIIAGSARNARRFAERFLPWDPYERNSASWKRVSHAIWNTRVLSRNRTYTDGIRAALFDASEGVPSFAQIMLGIEQRTAFPHSEINLERMVREAHLHPLIGRYIVDIRNQRKHGPSANVCPEVRLLRPQRLKESGTAS